MDNSRAPGNLASRWYRPVMAGLAISLLAFGAYVTWVSWTHLSDLGRIGADLDLYLVATRRWLAGGSFYLQHQLVGPYVIADGDILYPPITIPLFMAFLVLPEFLFWVLPLSIIAWVTYRYRPAPWTWPLMALCIAYIPTMVKVMHGNPFMWSAAAVALGTVYGWPALLVILKPSLAPFALAGVGHRSWWIGLIVIVISTGASVLLFGSVWRDYLTVMENSRNPAGLLYSYTDVGLLFLPVVAYVGRTRAWSTSARGAATSG